MSKTLTKADIVEAIHSSMQRSRGEIRDAVERLFDIMSNALKKENSMLLSGFGKFECYEKQPRRGRNPHTEEAIILPGRRVIVFRISRKFRTELNAK